MITKESAVILGIITLIFINSCSDAIYSKLDDGYTYKLKNNWRIISSEQVKDDGAKISLTEFDCNKNWYKINVPSTILGGLINNGEYEHWYFEKNIEKIPKSRFRCPWWFRKEFQLSEKNKYVSLVLNGINYRADIFLNGEKIASSDTLKGAFRVFNIDITDYVKHGKNVVALKVFPPRPGDFTIGFVDWNPIAADRNMGLWRGVDLRITGPISIENPVVETDVDVSTLKSASINIKTNLVNHSNKKVFASLKALVDGKSVTKRISLLPNEIKEVALCSDDYPILKFKNPKLWWPNGLGPQNLYKLSLTVNVDGEITDAKSITFGIRKVDDYLTDDGYRGYKVNGRKVLIRGAGWVDDIFLSDSDEKIDAQLRYARDMNLNCIRLEGFWGSSQKLYDLADKYGLLVMVGWSCQWEWENYLGKPVDDFGGVRTKEDMDLVTEYLKDQILMLRHHPSVFLWVLGSDMLPRPELEKRFLTVISETDRTRPILGSCAEKVSEITGPTGVKMTGPYDYVPPIYWYVDKENGGAFGFNTETGPGPQPPPIESVKRMITEKNIWPVSDMWNFHCARNEFNTMETFINALNHRYGNAENINEFLLKSQVQSYEAIRGMFESYIVNQPKATGVIQWMLNSAWPETYWQLFDWFLQPNGAFFGTMKANQPLNLIYNYADNTIYAVNLSLEHCKDMEAAITLLNKDSEIILSESKKIVDLSANGIKPIYRVSLKDIKIPVFFLDLKLLNKSGDTVSNNFYWLSKAEEKMDFQKTIWYLTPIKDYADYRALNKLEPCNLEVSKSIKFKGDKGKANINIKNISDKVAFFIEVKLVKTDSQDPVLPVFWNDNYVSILPGEERELICEFYKSDTEEQKVDIIVTGWNCGKINIERGK